MTWQNFPDLVDPALVAEAIIHACGERPVELIKRRQTRRRATYEVRFPHRVVFFKLEVPLPYGFPELALESLWVHSPTLASSSLSAYCGRMSRYIHQSQNVSVVIYHAVCPATYRRAVFTTEVDAVLKAVGLDIAKRYEIVLLDIGTDHDHVPFLLQSVPTYSPTKIVTPVKRSTAREIFQRVPSVKRQRWGGAFWSSGYCINTVGRYGSEAVIQRYVQKQGRAHEYQRLHTQQLALL